MMTERRLAILALIGIAPSGTYDLTWRYVYEFGEEFDLRTISRDIKQLREKKLIEAVSSSLDGRVSVYKLTKLGRAELDSKAKQRKVVTSLIKSALDMYTA